ncbi:MAG: DUF559 domain-containing protein [Candidatus Margulisiibacteriota bacterium]
MVKRVKVQRARELRKGQTEAEARLWWLLRKKLMLGYKFRRQHVIKGFILDFYCPQARLGVELDGGIHKQQEDYDKARDKVLKDHGVEVIRFTNKELFQAPVKVISLITKVLSIRPSPSKMERGDQPDCIGLVGEEKRMARTN